MTRRLLLPLLLCSIACAAANCTAADRSLWLPTIYSDLAPFANGITLKQFSDAAAYVKALYTGGCMSAVVRVRDRRVEAKWLDTPSEACLHGQIGPAISLIQTAAAAAALPDSVFLMHTKDLPDNEQSERDALHPVFHFCSSRSTRNIMVESYVLAGLFAEDMEDKVFGGAVVRVRGHPDCSIPWAEREDVLFAAWSSFDRAAPFTSDTMRLNENRKPDVFVRASLERAAAALNDSSVRINLPDSRRPLGEWARYKYIVFADGITCSNKLWELLFTGSLILVEQSGYRCLARTALQPYVHYIPVYVTLPTDLGPVLAWVRAHPEESERIAAAARAWAEEYLTPAKLGCRWQLLLEEYNKLLRFDLRDTMALFGW